MNSRSRKFPIALVIVPLLLLVLVGAFFLSRPAPAPAGNLTGAAIGGPFTLVDENNRTVTSDTFAGQWRLMYFGFTWCPDICPTDAAALGAGLRSFTERAPERAAKVEPLFVTVDPERDTPEALAEFTDHFHPRLLGLTGSPEQVTDALKTFRIHATRVEGATPGSYTMDHSAMIYLMDPDGKPVEFIARPTAADVDQMLERFVS